MGHCRWLARHDCIYGLSERDFIQSLIALVHPSYDAKLWQGTLLFYATAFFCLSINTVVSTALPKIEIIVLVLFVLGFFGTLVLLVTLGPHGSAKDVFTTFIFSGKWPSQGLSFFVELSGTVYVFLSWYFHCE